MRRHEQWLRRALQTFFQAGNTAGVLHVYRNAPGLGDLHGLVAGLAGDLVGKDEIQWDGSFCRGNWLTLFEGP